MSFRFLLLSSVIEKSILYFYTMGLHKKILQSVFDIPFPILNYDIPKYTLIDLSINNKELNNLNINNPTKCQNYIDTVLERTSASVAYGGYLEKRNLYSGNPNFSSTGNAERNIHLGIDFWSRAGTKVMIPVNGKVHSFKNNAVIGDYGPTIILKHEVNGFHFHTLYGHLSVESIENLNEGKEFKKGAILGTLGSTAINVNYAPHLHFQIIIDIADRQGDYPGVCSEVDLEFYAKNCPDPNLLLRM